MIDSKMDKQKTSPMRINKFTSELVNETRDSGEEDDCDLCEHSDGNNSNSGKDCNYDADHLISMSSNRNKSNSVSKTSFSVDDILSPSKFTGQVTSFTPEYFMRWQPWLMQEALRQNCAFSDLTLSFYKPFLANHKNGKCL